MITTYPRVATRIAADDVVAEDCELCDARATRTVRIEYNTIRRDDDVFDVCGAHFKAAHVDPQAFVLEYVQMTVDEASE